MTITIIISSLMLVGYLLIATERLTGVNKSAVAMFLGTLGWILYVTFGNDFVMAQHHADYNSFLSGMTPNSETVKDYIAENVYIKYVGKAAEIVLYLIATTMMVELLHNNGCFDFVTQWMRMRNGKRLLWIISAFTLAVSANLDNLTTTMMMLAALHKILSNRRQRAVYGAAVVLSANIGGALTVIGDTNGLMLWHLSAVTPTHFSAWMLLPCLMAWAVPVFIFSRMVPERVDVEHYIIPYRGDDTNFKIWQRVVLFFVAIVGLWFVPTFHNITHLSPCLGALCVLSLIWIVNEIFNHKLMITSQRIEQRLPFALQYTRLQTILFVMGIMLCTGVLIETGGTIWLGDLLHSQLGDVFTIYAAPMLACVVSMFLDTFATASAFFSLFNVSGTQELGLNGEYWILIAYATAMGGSILCIGSLSGIVLMKMEGITMAQYLRRFTMPICIGALLGLLILVAEVMYFG